MAINQANLTETIAQIAVEAAKVTVQGMAMSSAKKKNNQRVQNVGPKISSPLKKQPTLNWSSTKSMQN